MAIVWLFAALQATLGVNVVLRMLRSARGTVIASTASGTEFAGAVSVIVPVLDEIARLGRCLDALRRFGPEVREILVVDGGSADGTQGLAASYAREDARIRLIDAGPPPAGWNGKAWNLECGLRAAAPGAAWIATIDADVRPRPGMPRAVLAHAEQRGVVALSVATQQKLGDWGSAVLHPAMLTTLVYRYGLPGNATRDPAAVQANGQCFLARRDVLVATNAFTAARASVCEDVTVARVLARAGHSVGFYEANDMVAVRMYDTWRDVWANWPRSLTLRDGIPVWHTALGLAEIVGVQALPLPLAIALAALGHHGAAPGALFGVNAVLTMMRIGVLIGTRRAYRNPGWTYWLSLLADLPVAAALIASALRRRHTWRGRTLVMSERKS